MHSTLADLIARTGQGREVWAPGLYSAGDDATGRALARLVDAGEVTQAYDTLVSQLGELCDTRSPALKRTPEETAAAVTESLAGRAPARYGTWVHYPWSRRLVHVLPGAEYRELRTSRNRNKITADEQAKL